MTQKYGFFNSVNGDRAYDAGDWALFLSKYFTNGIFNNGLKVSASSGMNVTVSSGDANINGYRFSSDENTLLTLSSAHSTMHRYDNIVIRWNLNERTISLMVVKGNNNSTPTPTDPTRTAVIYDLVLARVLVKAGTIEITNSLVTDTRFDSDLCGNVVGAVQQIDTTDVFKQYDDAFNYWFENIKGILSEDVAGHLQVEIDEKANKTDVEQLSNDNLLINANFKNTINQREKENYFSQTKNSYSIDRWMIGKTSLGLYVHDDYIAIVNDSASVQPVSQYMERKLSGSMTLSCKLNEDDKVYVHTTDDATKDSSTHFTNFALKILGTGNAIQILIDGRSTVDFEWIKLENGSIATAFVPRPKSEELAMCKLFYQCGFFSGGIRYEYGGQAGNDFTYNVRFDFPAMRVCPTYTQGDFKCSFIDNTGNILKPTITEVNEITKNCALVTTSKSIRKANGCNNILIGGMLDAEIYPD